MGHCGQASMGVPRRSCRPAARRPGGQRQGVVRRWRGGIRELGRGAVRRKTSSTGNVGATRRWGGATAVPEEENGRRDDGGQRRKRGSGRRTQWRGWSTRGG